MKINIGDIILWILFIISIAVGLWYLFGNSPTFEQSMIIFLMTSVFGIVIIISKLEARFDFFEVNTRNSFSKIKEEMKFIKDDVTVIKHDITLIKKKLKIV